jgi:hypothetical protein
MIACEAHQMILDGLLANWQPFGADISARRYPPLVAHV